jgi:hypothetical protein
MKTAAAVLTGVLLGVLAMSLVHPSRRANAQQAGVLGQMHIHVGEVPRFGEVDMNGSQVVGFSCINTVGQSSPLLFRCFIATKD